MDFRYAERKDVMLILEFIKELADYENMSEEVIATPQLLEEWIFEKKKAEVIFCVADGVEVGFALVLHCFFIIFLLFSVVPEFTLRICL